MASNRFNQILIIDSIPDGGLNTASRLYQDVEMHAALFAPSPVVAIVRVTSGNEFIECLHQCRLDVVQKDVMPMIHIECHGDDGGFQFADGSILDWEEMKQPLTELNVATRLNLMIAVAACTGGALAKVVGLSDRAPFWGLIGPTMPLSAGKLESAYSALYLTLLKTKSPELAMQAMDAVVEPGSFWRTTAQGLFLKIWVMVQFGFSNVTTP